MDFATGALLLFPAFLIGAAFGIMIILVLAGGTGIKDKRPFVFSVVGSVVGVISFLLTQTFWPPIIGPFILCPAAAATAALIARKG